MERLSELLVSIYYENIFLTLQSSSAFAVPRNNPHTKNESRETVGIPERKMGGKRR